ncbi:MAG: DUF4070 domain-containing protein [Planctomycetaceae bacterium]|nr:DUF4070 domain-containing protein [Planctomycetaceae bacterium]
MNILLVNPESPNTFWSLKNALYFVSKKAMLPPLGLLTIASMLPEDWNKKLIDLNTTALTDEHLAWADYVFLTAMVVQKRSADQIIARCRQLDKPVVAGGPLVTAFPEAFPQVDHLVMNEAELTLPAFLKDLQAGRAQPFYYTHDRPALERTPLPMWSLIDMKKYALMSIQYSRGCPFDCEFCDVTTLFGRQIRVKRKDHVIGELDALYRQGWRGDVFFVDDNFIGKKDGLKQDLLPAMIEWMERNGRPFAFNTQASINLADDDELMRLMVRAGFDCVFIGIESNNDDSLAECNKLQNKGRDLHACVSRIQRAGMQVQAGFILGFDHDQPCVFDRMIQFIQTNGIVTAMVGLLNAPRGTRLYQRMLRENRIARLSSGDNTDYSTNIIPRMDFEKLVAGYYRVVSTIYSPKYHSQRIKIFLRNFNLKRQTVCRFRRWDLLAFLRSVWHIGICEKGRVYYWRLLFWSLRNPHYFRMAVTFSIYGFHFRKTFEQMRQRGTTERHPALEHCGPAVS